MDVVIEAFGVEIEVKVRVGASFRVKRRGMRGRSLDEEVEQR